MKREADEDQADDLGQRLFRLGLRRHASAERLASGEKRHVLQSPRRLDDSRPHGGLRERRRIRPLQAFLHVRKLEAHSRDPAFSEFPRERRHERMVHSGTGAVRENVGGQRAPAPEEACVNLFALIHRKAKRRGFRRHLVVVAMTNDYRRLQTRKRSPADGAGIAAIACLVVAPLADSLAVELRVEPLE